MAKTKGYDPIPSDDELDELGRRFKEESLKAAQDREGFVIYVEHLEGVLKYCKTEHEQAMYLEILLNAFKTGSVPCEYPSPALEIYAEMSVKRLARDTEIYARKTFWDKYNGSVGGKEKQRKKETLGKHPLPPLTKGKSPLADKDRDKDLDLDKDKDKDLSINKLYGEYENVRIAPNVLEGLVATHSQDVEVAVDRIGNRIKAGQIAKDIDHTQLVEEEFKRLQESR